MLTANDVFAPGSGCVSRADWLGHYNTTALQHYSTTVLPNGVHFYYKADDVLWWLGKISARTTTDIDLGNIWYVV